MKFLRLLLLAPCLLALGLARAADSTTPPPNDTATLVAQIQNSTFKARDELGRRILARVDAAQDTLAALRELARTGDATLRTAATALLEEARLREADLRASVRAATNAGSEPDWGELQAALVRDFRAFADVMGRVTSLTAPADAKP